MKIHKLFWTFLLSLFIGSLSAQVLPDSCKLRIGTNLSGPVDYGSEYPFVNIMKYSREWISHNDSWVSGGQNLWDTQLLGSIPMDANGYPLSLPVAVPGAEAPQVIRTVWANTEALPEGVYVVLYDGVGELDVWGDATLLSEAPGRLEFQMNYSGDLFALEIQSSQLGDHVRNIRVLLPGTEATYQSNQWSQEWLDKLEPFKALRFMDWGYTNSSPMRNWAERTQVEDFTWTQKSGVPYEKWIEICNLKQADAWVCIPHAASDDYIQQMATLFRDNLDPNLKIYVEYSNEVWNWIFEQAHYGLDSLDQNLPWPERLGPKISHSLEVWTDVFAGEEDRLVRVLAMQHAWWDLVERTYAQIELEGKDHLIDAISPAAYMGFDGDEVQNWNETTSPQYMLDHAANFAFDNNEYAMQGWHAFANLAQSKGKRLVFYEGGQHFTPQPFGTVQPYCDSLVAIQTLPGMYDLYQQLFDTLRTLSNEEMLLMNFSFLGPQSCQYGSWGLLESQFSTAPPYDNAPKYRAVVDAIAQYESCQPISTTFENAAYLDFMKVYPNPGTDLLFIEIDPAFILDGEAQLRILDLRGQTRANHLMQNGSVQLDVSTLEPGAYQLILQTQTGAQNLLWIKQQQ